MEIKMHRGDLTAAWKGPIPFKDRQGRTIGRVIAVRYENGYTVGTIEMHDGALDETAKVLAPRIKLAD